MSVVVLNVEELTMYADTAVSFGYIDSAQYKKVRHYQTAGYDILMGGVGTPEAIDIMSAAALIQIETCADRGQEPGQMPSVMGFESLDTFAAIRGMINAMSDKAKMSSDVLIVAKHIETDKVHIGVMNDSALIQWGTEPVLGDDCIVLGTTEVVAAWNGTDRSAGMYSRISTLQRVIQFLKSPNKFTVTNIYGKTETYLPD